MNVIKFNNTEFPVTSYNKTTNFYDGGMSSNAYAAIQVDNMADLTALAETQITSIKIYHYNTLIYNLDNINAHFDNINESLGEDQIYVTVNLTFVLE